ncbi:unnamed protein product [Dibothriocephalus latus]|uniref:Uncharacterized protein n=1 Tax=Dibothriocephalus latus TaxID=60516 RepID=A0A3P6VBH0_DIBLA|nr:unnamed protein product [Dibothriocephalus latus]
MSAHAVICGKNYPKERTASTSIFKNYRRLMVSMAIKFGERPICPSKKDTGNSKAYVDIVKDAFGYNGSHRRQMDIVILLPIK